MTRQIAAGFGCKRGCELGVLSELLDQTLRQWGLQRSAIVAIASLDRKADEPGLVQLAAQLGVPFHTFSAEALLPFEAQLTHRSAVSHAHTGCHGVAESCAMALAQASQVPPGAEHSAPAPRARLIAPRQVLPGATLALATVPSA